MGVTPLIIGGARKDRDRALNNIHHDNPGKMDSDKSRHGGNKDIMIPTTVTARQGIQHDELLRHGLLTVLSASRGPACQGVVASSSPIVFK